MKPGLKLFFKKLTAGIVAFTFFVTGIAQNVIGIDLKKAFAEPPASWFMPVAGAIGNLSDPSAPIQSKNTDLFTGSAQTSVPIFTPSARLGLTPQVALSYSSQAGNSWLGIGWDLPFDEIVRSTKRGVPHYNDAQDTFIISLSGTSSELVEIASGEYRAKYDERFHQPS